MRYITTPIYYVNDNPHIGHAYTSIAADVIARFYKMYNEDEFVKFVTGSDEHGQKVQRSAEQRGVNVLEFCDEVSASFRNLSEVLNLSNDDFIRTTEQRHITTVEKMWDILYKKGFIYKSYYEGWYNQKDEAFVLDSEVVNGCDSNGYKLEFLKEESYFFALSKFQKPLLEFYEATPDFIKPSLYMNEVKSFVSAGLNDLSISRTSFDWGIKVPKDNSHVVYVWLDALCNYLSAIEYFSDDSSVKAKAEKFWKNSIHILGKDIVKFHAIYWPAFLMAAEIAPPKKLIVHGWWTVERNKMSKSLKNTVNPVEIVDKYGLDQFRYFLFKESTFGYDCDFSETGIKNKINYDLCNDYGNLVNRVLSLALKDLDDDGYFVISQDSYDDVSEITLEVKALHFKLKSRIEDAALTEYLNDIFSVISLANKFVQDSAPWNLLKHDLVKFRTSISILLHAIINISYYLSPFMPDTITKVFNFFSIQKIKQDILTQRYTKFKIMNVEPIFVKLD